MLAPATVLALAVAIGCGDDSSAPATRSDPAAGATAAQGSDRGGERGDEYPGVFANAKEICGIGSRRRVAANTGASSTRPRAIARAFARGYRPALRKRAFRGCLAGLR
jgi:hypothetical protein